MVLLGGPGGQGRSFIGHPVSKGDSSMVNRYKVTYRLPRGTPLNPSPQPVHLHRVINEESSSATRTAKQDHLGSMAVMPKRPTNHTNDSVWGVDQRRTSTQGSVRATRWLIWGSLV
ncbi:hypothetical protein PGTUg99_011810 [Puccinia graminis f. sp. tritici]|uniref:Uncharacterized protein n=1 Tax=Puccinia graminis f. sp. tritici TaxID=56615 RepID=A0A5B0RRK0_PUCGR|nr:hypothetical protein PGTUg99_011810 [Puccinia graminis f. sp. tritici]